MSQYLYYKTEVMVTPENTDIHIDERFYEHHGRSKDDWPKLLEIAKLLPEARKKHILGFPLTKEENHAYDLYYGEKKPLLSMNDVGKVEVSDGRHRMEALRQLGISIPLQVNTFLHLEQVRDVSDIYKEEKFLFFRKQTSELQDDIKCIVIKNIHKNLRDVLKSDYKVVHLMENSYAVINKEDINIPEEFKMTVKEMLEHDISVYKSRDELISAR